MANYTAYKVLTGTAYRSAIPAFMDAAQADVTSLQGRATNLETGKADNAHTHTGLGATVSPFAEPLIAAVDAPTARGILGAAAAAAGVAPPIINGGCRVAERQIANISNTYQYGQVDRWACRATGTISGGTIQRVAVPWSQSGSACGIVGLVAVDAGGGVVASWRYRAEGADAAALASRSCVISALVYSESGGHNWRITVRKANALDNFTATTTIATSSDTSVPAATATRLVFMIQNMGACAYGVEIEISVNCGTISGGYFYMSDVQHDLGEEALPYRLPALAQDANACKRYYWLVSRPSATVAIIGQGQCNGTTMAMIIIPLPSMRAVPSLIVSAAANFVLRAGGSNILCAGVFLSPDTTDKVARLDVSVAGGLTIDHGTIFAAGTTGGVVAFSADL